jgi:hypothetical protein
MGLVAGRSSLVTWTRLGLSTLHSILDLLATPTVLSECYKTPLIWPCKGGDLCGLLPPFLLFACSLSFLLNRCRCALTTTNLAHVQYIV